MKKTKIRIFILVIAVVFIIIASWLCCSQIDSRSRVVFFSEGGGYHSAPPPCEFVEYVSQVLRTNGFTVLSIQNTGPYIHSDVESYEDISVFFRGDHVSGEIKIDWSFWDYDGYWIEFYVKAKDKDHVKARDVINNLNYQFRHLPD